MTSQILVNYYVGPFRLILWQAACIRYCGDVCGDNCAAGWLSSAAAIYMPPPSQCRLPMSCYSHYYVMLTRRKAHTTYNTYNYVIHVLS